MMSPHAASHSHQSSNSHSAAGNGIAEVVRQVIGQCSYSQLDARHRMGPISYHPASKKMLIKDFYSEDHTSSKGSCAELMNYTYMQLKGKLPGKEILRAKGRDNDWYTSPNTRHTFIMLADEGVMGRKKSVDGETKIRQMVGKGTLIADPSFGTVMPYFQSGYTVNKVFRQGAPMEYSKDLLLHESHAVPLGITSKGEIAFLKTNLGNFEIAFFRKGFVGTPLREIYDLPSRRLDTKLEGEAEFIEFVNALRANKPTISETPLSASPAVPIK